MSTLLSARALMGVSLGFHIVYATIGIGLPLMLMIAEGLALRTGEEIFHHIARRWVRPAGVLFAIGAVSGTILSFELGFLWPTFMSFSGPLIGIPFWMEGFAFFTEAIFLALYIYGEQRLSRRMLFFCTIPLTLAAAASAAFVISANSWMNTPAGAVFANGRLTDVRPVQALFNPAWFHEAVHGTFAAYVATGFVMAGVYAASLLRGRITDFNKRALTLSMAIVGVFLPFMLLTGDWASRFVAMAEKPKLAAMEALFTTSRGAPLIIGGWPDPASGKVLYGIEVPKLLSMLIYRNPDAVVEGLNAFPPGDVPDPRLVHPFFDLMVGSFFIMLSAAVWFWLTYWLRRERAMGRWNLRAILIASPLGMVALECGWLVTEFGRQPWIVRGLMRVDVGVTPNAGIGMVFLTFMTLYILLTAGLLRLLPRPTFGGTDATREEPHGYP